MDPQPRGPDWMPITPKTGSLFHACSQIMVKSHLKLPLVITSEVYEALLLSFLWSKPDADYISISVYHLSILDVARKGFISFQKFKRSRQYLTSDMKSSVFWCFHHSVNSRVGFSGSTR